MEGSVVRLIPLGMRKDVKIEAAEPLTGKVNYFIGNDSKKWRTNIPTYRAVVYKEAYLKFYGNEGQLEYDIVVKAGADPSRLKFQYAGIEALRVTPEGDLAIHLPAGGILLQKKPLVYQEVAGQRVLRDGKFRVHNGGARLTYSFEVASYDRQFALIIDPVLVYSTYLGGSISEYVEGIAVDHDGQAYITGWTDSGDFPTTSGAYQPQMSKNPYYNYADAFVSKFSADGSTLIYSTFLGGTEIDNAHAIAVDQFGQAYVTGTTHSGNFPVQNPAQAAIKGKHDVFVTKLSADGSACSTPLFWGAVEKMATGIQALPWIRTARPMSRD